MTTLISRTLISLVAISLLILSRLSWLMEKPHAGIKRCFTSEDIDHVIEADAAVPLLCAFEEILDVLVLTSGQDRPLLIDQFLEIHPTSAPHQSKYLCYIFQIYQFRLDNKSIPMRKVKEDDVHDRERSHTTMTDFAKSFQGGASKRFVNITLPDIELKGKDLYKKQPHCMVCYRSFTTTFRQHHCRICANAVCGDCSRSMINKERACDLCILRLSSPHEEKKKKEMLETLETLCAFLLYRKQMKMSELEQLKNSEGIESEEYRSQLWKQEKQIEETEEENKELRERQKKLAEELEQVRERNQKIENEISLISSTIPNYQEY